MEQDRKTVISAKEIHLENALAALRKAISLAETDGERDELTNAAVTVAQHRRDAGQALADLAEAHARFATTLLES